MFNKSYITTALNLFQLQAIRQQNNFSRSLKGNTKQLLDIQVSAYNVYTNTRKIRHQKCSTIDCINSMQAPVPLPLHSSNVLLYVVDIAKLQIELLLQRTEIQSHRSQTVLPYKLYDCNTMNCPMIGQRHCNAELCLRIT